jgi:dihydrofolate reductase
MKYKMIVAMDEKNGIGKDNKIPWHFREDMKFFADETKGLGNNAIIMGRKTFESIGRLLPDRYNIVISRSPCPDKYVNSAMKWCASPEEADIFCQMKQIDTVWIIGGSTIYDYYAQNTAIVDELIVTNICDTYDCDAFFSKKNLKKFAPSRVLKILNVNNTQIFFIHYIKK